MRCNTCCSPFETGNVPGVSRINNQYQPIRLATANGLWLCPRVSMPDMFITIDMGLLWFVAIESYWHIKQHQTWVSWGNLLGVTPVLPTSEKLPSSENVSGWTPAITPRKHQLEETSPFEKSSKALICQQKFEGNGSNCSQIDWGTKELQKVTKKTKNLKNHQFLGG